MQFIIRSHQGRRERNKAAGLFLLAFLFSSPAMGGAIDPGGMVVMRDVPTSPAQRAAKGEALVVKTSPDGTAFTGMSEAIRLIGDAEASTITGSSTGTGDTGSLLAGTVVSGLSGTAASRNDIGGSDAFNGSGLGGTIGSALETGTSALQSALSAVKNSTGGGR